MKQYTNHHLADIFPLMPAGEMKSLVADIRVHGLRQPIVLYEEKILDGRHRYEACYHAKVTPRFAVYRGKDPFGFVVSANLHRRQLTAAQCAAIAATVANTEQGQKASAINESKLNAIQTCTRAYLNEDGKDATKITQKEAASAMNVSVRSVSRAKKIMTASPEIGQQVIDGKLSLKAAERKIDSKQSEPVLDEIGWEIPSDLHEFWGRRGVMMTMMRELASIKNLLIEAQETSDLMFRGLNYSDAVMKLQFLHGEISGLRPYAVCVTCQGRATRTKCTHCKGKGFLAQYAYRLVPPEVRAIREKGCKK